MKLPRNDLWEVLTALAVFLLMLAVIGVTSLLSAQETPNAACSAASGSFPVKSFAHSVPSSLLGVTQRAEVSLANAPDEGKQEFDCVPDPDCATCEGTGLVRNPDSGHDVECPACCREEFGKVLDGSRIERWKKRPHPIIEGGKRGIGGLLGLPALPAQLLKLLGITCGGCLCFGVVAVVALLVLRGRK